MSGAPRAALLTGERGAGKTTICLDLARENPLCTGIVSLPLLDGRGERIGLVARSLPDGEEWELARSDRDMGGPRTRRFSFSEEGIRRAVLRLRESLGRREMIAVIDEIGPLELEMGAGFHPVLPLLSSAGSLLVVVRPALLARLSVLVPRHVWEIFTVTPETRGRALDRLREFLPASPAG
jgi:nucleoside-triphosphatase THEP1